MTFYEWFETQKIGDQLIVSLATSLIIFPIGYFFRLIRDFLLGWLRYPNTEYVINGYWVGVNTTSKEDISKSIDLVHFKKRNGKILMRCWHYHPSYKKQGYLYRGIGFFKNNIFSLSYFLVDEKIIESGSYNFLLKGNKLIGFYSQFFQDDDNEIKSFKSEDDYKLERIDVKGWLAFAFYLNQKPFKNYTEAFLYCKKADNFNRDQS